MSELVTPSQPGSPSRASRAFYRAYLAVTRPSRLPAARQIGLGLGVLAVVFILLVAFGISGTSSGVLYGQFYRGHDPQLLLGSPRPIRSDEWLVAGPLTIAQVQQGLPRMSQVFPGGMDASIVWDLPYREWSVLLRPHMWGFFFLPSLIGGGLVEGVCAGHGRVGG